MFAPSGRVRGILAGAAIRRKLAESLIFAAALAIGCDSAPPEAKAPVATELERAVVASAPEYVGSEQCAGCHATEARAWANSHHDLAMQEASSDTVLGRFDGSDVVLDGQIWQFVAKETGAPFRVRVPEDDGEPRIRDIAYAFGVTPLQQYLVRETGGRLQPLPVAWDSRSLADGGQRWFHLYEGREIPPNDSLHWTGRLQTWNHQCASCHSTNLEKRYDEASDRYDTRWAELDVGCESCHGKGSSHVRWATSGKVDKLGPGLGLVALHGKSASTWSFVANKPIAVRAAAPNTQTEIEVCAPCHSRRAALTETHDVGRAFLDGYQPSLLEADLYFDDGQIRDEVYVWGSFAQSRMHDAGVTCSDCHDPHSLKVRGGPDAVCSSCHAPTTFAVTEHHGHPADSEGASCVACHMPTRTYMGVDERRDHSMRVPRPDLSAEVGSPDACTSCHNDQSQRWAAEALAARGARRATPHFASAIHAARAGQPDAQPQLASAVADPELAAIVRATAASLLDVSHGPEAATVLRGALQDRDALVRMGALRALEQVQPNERVPVARNLLRDPRAAVRVEAARVLAAAAPGAWPPGARAPLADAVAEYRAGQLANADRYEAQLNLSVLDAQLGEHDEAIRRAKLALEFEPSAVAARVNLADLLRVTGREAEADSTLRAGLGVHSESPELHFALGLSLVRQGKTEAALSELGIAAKQAPEARRFAYTYGIALHSVGRSAEAVETLVAATRTSEIAARDASLLFALATIERDRGNREAAIGWAGELAEAHPSDPRPATLMQELRGR